jgi:small-conductance mechanosensitive channel
MAVVTGVLGSATESVPDSTMALAPSWLQFPGYRVVAAVLVVFLGISLANLAVRLLARPLARRFERQSVAQTVMGGIRAGIVLVTLVAAGSLVGLQLGNIALSVTVFSAVVGVILAPIVGNVLNGVFVLADQPFEIGDMIELSDGTRGFVDDITIRYTKIFTLDNTFIVIPNGNIRDRDVTNYSAEDERTRLTVAVLVTYESDIPAARRSMETAARDTENVIKGGPDIRIGSARYPASPRCFIDDFADDGVLLRLRFWATKPYTVRATESAVRTEIRQRFADGETAVEMAYPHRQLVIDDRMDTTGDAEGGVVADTDEATDSAAGSTKTDDAQE